MIANDGNLLPHPVQVPAVALGVAERSDVIIDFAQYAGKTIYIENRLNQPNGQAAEHHWVHTCRRQRDVRS